LSLKASLSLLFICLPLVMVTAENQASADPDCPPAVNNPGPVIVHVTQHIPVLVQDTSKSRREITQMDGKSSDGVFSYEGPNIGLQHEYAFSTTQTVQPTTCLWVTSVDADVTVKKMVIYSARESPPGSCRYLEIMAHERVHFQTFSTLVNLYTERLRAAIQELDLPSSAQPWSVTTLEGGTSQIATLLIGVQQSVSDSFEREFKRQTDEFHERELHKQSRCRH